MTVEKAYVVADICTKEWVEKGMFPELCERAWFREGCALWVLSEFEEFHKKAWPGVK